MVGKILDYITDKLLLLFFQFVTVVMFLRINEKVGITVTVIILLYYISKIVIFIIDKKIKEY